MDKKTTFDEKTPLQLKTEYQELVLRILELWLKIPPEMLPDKQQEFELTILEELAYSYVQEMQKRGIFLIIWMVTNG